MTNRNSYSQTKRIITLFRILCRSRAAKTLEQIKEELVLAGIDGAKEVSDRSLQRDIKFIREEMGYMVMPVPGEGYLLDNQDKKGNELLPLYFDPDEIRALCMGRELFTPFDGTHLADSIESVYDKIATAYTGKSKLTGTSKTLLGMEDIFMIQPRKQRAYNKHKKVIKTIVNSINARRVVEVSYGYPGCDSFTFCIRPYRLIIYCDTFYLMAVPENYKKDDFRMYLMARVRAATETNRTFKRTSMNQVEKRLDQAWGIHMKGEPEHITITFDEGLAGYLQERVWHPSQKFTMTKKGLEMHLDVLLNDEITHWILGFGKRVKSVKPRKLKNMLNKEK
ncbi:MAG: WYL domain-containing protein [Fibrobacteria bacterium]|nr:WYL domain-containing protein [Fibrobacteria bacterium]